MVCLVTYGSGLCETLCDDAESPVYVRWQFWMYANFVACMLSNLLVMLCVWMMNCCASIYCANLFPQ